VETAKLKNTLIYLIGYPGTGKYTIAQDIVQKTGFRLVDNHLINNPIFSVIRLDGQTKLPERVWTNVTKVWEAVSDTLIHVSQPDESFILTNWLRDGDEGDQIHFERVCNIAVQRRAHFVPIRLLISDVGEHARRITTPSRKDRMKQTDPEAPQRYASMDVLQVGHPNVLSLDITRLTASEAGDIVLTHAHKTFG
jgi:hypothetical protein